jgi:hypothetical protein
MTEAERLLQRQKALRALMADPAEYRKKLTKRPALYWPQAKAARIIEEAIRNPHAQRIAIRSARQTMKNEVAALVHVRFLVMHKSCGGSIVRTAPTYDPQIVNSKMRLEQAVADDLVISRNEVRSREGNIRQYGRATIQFLSTGGARVEGATASKLLDIDEAHLVDKGSFNEKFMPMRAFFAAPTCMWGVAADKNDLLYEQVCHNLGHPPDPGQVIAEKGVLQFPASLWCELRPEYRATYEADVKQLGADNPKILTQYDLVDVDTTGGFLKAHQLRTILAGQHPARRAPRSGEWLEHVAVIDIGGEDESGETLGSEMMSSGARDSTVAYVIEVDHDPVEKAKHNGHPMCRVIFGYWWTGKQLATDPKTGLPGQQEILLSLLKKFDVRRYVVDARGVGLQLASYLTQRHRGGLAYAAGSGSVSDDCYSFLGIVSNGAFQLWKPGTEFQPSMTGGEGAPDVTLQGVRAECVRQMGWTGYYIAGHDSMSIVKPAGGGRHIDHVKALTYLPRCLALQKPVDPTVLPEPAYTFIG